MSRAFLWYSCFGLRQIHFQTRKDELLRACDRLPRRGRFMQRSLLYKSCCFILSPPRLCALTGLPSHLNGVRFVFKQTFTSNKSSQSAYSAYDREISAQLIKAWKLRWNREFVWWQFIEKLKCSQRDRANKVPAATSFKDTFWTISGDYI